MGSFYIIRREKMRGEAPVPNWRRRLPRKLYEEYLLKTLPINAGPVSVLQTQGYLLCLPFSRDGTERYSEGFPLKFLKALMKKYNMETIYIEKPDRAFFNQEVQRSVRLLPYLFLPEIIAAAAEECGLSFRELHPAVMDSGDMRVLGLLEWLALRLNHLTLLTDRPSYFWNFCEEVYKETGLAVEVITVPSRERIRGNFIIDCGCRFLKEYYNMETGLTVVAPDMTPDAFSWLVARRKDLKIKDGFTVEAEGKMLEEELAETILCGENWRLRQFGYGHSPLCYGEEIQEIKKRYGIRLKYE